MEKNNQAAVAKTDKKAQKKNTDKKPNIFVRLGRKIKAVISELKKVTWPTFPTVLKQLGCVLVTVVIMLVLILAIDFGLQQLLNLIRPAADQSTQAIATLIGEVL